MLDRLLKARSKFPAAHNSRGLILGAMGQQRDAVTSFNQAVSLDPAYALAWINRGHALAALGRLADALASFDRAIAARPRDADGYYAKGQFLHGTGALNDALVCYDHAITTRPDFPEALNNRAVVQDALGRMEEAFADFARAVQLRPGFAEAWNNLGATQDRAGRYADSVASFRRAVASRPDFTGALLNLADSLYIGGRRKEALATVARCRAIDPSNMKARIFQLIFQLPILYDDEAEITERRNAYATELRALCDLVEADPEPRRFADAVGASQPFFLAYQGQSDVELQRLYGGMMGRISADLYPPEPLPPAPPSPGLGGRRIRVGFVSGFFRQHPAWRNVAQGWVNQLDRSRFELFGYHTSGWQDSETMAARAACDHFVQGPLDPAIWRTRILADAPDVLIYPEIGMDQTAALLAAQRLAPVQCNSWGHPDTSGLPTLDYFISSEWMEPEDGDAHYTERLVRLPGLGVYYIPRQIETAPFSRADMGVRDDVPVYWCGQSLYKYLPQHDEIYPRIAREVGACQFAFITFPWGTDVTEQFRRRLHRAFAAFGLDGAAHVVILPRMDGNQFSAATGQCDVVLDSIGWAGFNTNLESLPHDKPIVTFAGPLMRGRHTAAVMRTMGMPDMVAETIDSYVALAAELGRDPEQRARVGQRIAAAKGRVYRDRTSIAALEEFLKRVVTTG